MSSEMLLPNSPPRKEQWWHSAYQRPSEIDKHGVCHQWHRSIGGSLLKERKKEIVFLSEKKKKLFLEWKKQSLTKD